MENQPLTAFISGHTDLSRELFDQHYAKSIDDALVTGHRFVLGDATGADTLALEYLLQKSAASPEVKQRVTVYASRSYNVAKLKAQGVNVVPPAVKPAQGSEISQQYGRRGRHIQRDASLTAASDYDILWVRSEGESRMMYGVKWRPRVSATELNRLRRSQGQLEDLGTEKSKANSSDGIRSPV